MRIAGGASTSPIGTYDKMSDANKPYMVIFQDNAPKSEIDQEIKNVELGGGKITQRFDSDIMKGFAAQLPENLVLTYTQLTSNKDHKYLSYIEPDQEVHTMGAGGN